MCHRVNVHSVEILNDLVFFFLIERLQVFNRHAYSVSSPPPGLVDILIVRDRIGIVLTLNDHARARNSCFS